MNKRTMIITLTALLMGAAYMAEAHLETSDEKIAVVYNPARKTFHMKDSARYSTQTLEQKFLTIRSINRIENGLR